MSKLKDNLKQKGLESIKSFYKSLSYLISSTKDEALFIQKESKKNTLEQTISESYSMAGRINSFVLNYNDLRNDMYKDIISKETLVQILKVNLNYNICSLGRGLVIWMPTKHGVLTLSNDNTDDILEQVISLYKSHQSIFEEEKWGDFALNPKKEKDSLLKFILQKFI